MLAKQLILSVKEALDMGETLKWNSSPSIPLLI